MHTPHYVEYASLMRRRRPSCIPDVSAPHTPDIVPMLSRHQPQGDILNDQTMQRGKRVTRHTGNPNAGVRVGCALHEHALFG